MPCCAATVEGIQRAIVTRGGPSQYADEFRTTICCSNPGCQVRAAQAVNG